MKETVQIDGAGRVVLPKRFRETFRLKGGDKLSLEMRGDFMELHPTKSSVRLERVNGVLVLTSKTTLPENRDLVEDMREERIAEISRRK